MLMDLSGPESSLSGPAERRTGRTSDGGGWDHSVQFYDTDRFLCDSVADFLSDGLLVGDPLVVVATRAHRDGVIRRMGDVGLELEEARDTGRIRWLDAHELLETIMVGRNPDPERFEHHIGEPIRASQDGGGRVRAYGELVDLLWRDGCVDAALELEEMWNGLGRDGSLSLLCAYSRGNMYRESPGSHVRRICDAHTHVRPPENGAGAGS